MPAVFKDQCCLCLYQPEHNWGLFVCARHRISFCPKHIEHHVDYGCKELLNSQRTKQIIALPTNDEKSTGNKLTKLAIDPDAEMVSEILLCQVLYVTLPVSRPNTKSRNRGNASKPIPTSPRILQWSMAKEASQKHLLFRPRLSRPILGFGNASCKPCKVRGTAPCVYLRNTSIRTICTARTLWVCTIWATHATSTASCRSWAKWTT